jgi:hypothetical protein
LVVQHNRIRSLHIRHSHIVGMRTVCSLRYNDLDHNRRERCVGYECTSGEWRLPFDHTGYGPAAAANTMEDPGDQNEYC